jgi:hypothetical protein
MLVAALFALALALTANPRALAAPTGTVNVKWNAQALVSIKLFVNYATGYGQVPAVIGTQPAPTHGPDANCSNAAPTAVCSVDFGNVVTGKNYLYKYAVHLNVVSTSATGVDVYGEGAADFFNTADSSSIPISAAVYWLNSTSGSPVDPNTGFSAATPFLKTGGAVTNNSQFTVPSIAYTTYPAPISQSNTLNSDFYYDYQLKIPATATSGLYYVWIVYTVVGK